MKAAYSEWGYEIVEVPKISVQKRACFDGLSNRKLSNRKLSNHGLSDHGLSNRMLIKNRN